MSAPDRCASGERHAGSSHVDDLVARERAAQLWSAIDALPEKLRVVIVLANIEGHDMTARQLPRAEIPALAPRFRADAAIPAAGSAPRPSARHGDTPSATNRAATTAAAATASLAAEPEVLVDPREAAALRAFFARARRGDVALAAIVAPAATPLADTNDVHDIYITPIAFEPVTGATEAKGGRK